MLTDRGSRSSPASEVAPVPVRPLFVPFAVLYMKEPFKLDYLWAGLCILGAVFFIFRDKLMG